MWACSEEVGVSWRRDGGKVQRGSEVGLSLEVNAPGNKTRKPRQKNETFFFSRGRSTLHIFLFLTWFLIFFACAAGSTFLGFHFLVGIFDQTSWRDFSLPIEQFFKNFSLPVRMVVFLFPLSTWRISFFFFFFSLFLNKEDFSIYFWGGVIVYCLGYSNKSSPGAQIGTTVSNLCLFQHSSRLQMTLT